MNISKNHGSILLAAFLMLPYLISKILISLGFQDFGFVNGWKDFYEVAYGVPNNYSSVASLYLVLSPLVALWAHSKVKMQEVYFQGVFVSGWRASCFFVASLCGFKGTAAGRNGGPYQGNGKNNLNRPKSRWV